MVENNDMRETLKNMQTELINLLNQQNDDYESNTEVGKKYLLPFILFSNKDFSLQVFRILFNIISERILENRELICFEDKRWKFQR